MKTKTITKDMLIDACATQAFYNGWEIGHSTVLRSRRMIGFAEWTHKCMVAQENLGRLLSDIRRDPKVVAEARRGVNKGIASAK